jgi:hypothetical protein
VRSGRFGPAPGGGSLWRKESWASTPPVTPCGQAGTAGIVRGSGRRQLQGVAVAEGRKLQAAAAPRSPGALGGWDGAAWHGGHSPGRNLQQGGRTQGSRVVKREEQDRTIPDMVPRQQPHCLQWACRLCCLFLRVSGKKTRPGSGQGPRLECRSILPSRRRLASPKRRPPEAATTATNMTRAVRPPRYSEARPAAPMTTGPPPPMVADDCAGWNGSVWSGWVGFVRGIAERRGRLHDMRLICALCACQMALVAARWLQMEADGSCPGVHMRSQADILAKLAAAARVITQSGHMSGQHQIPAGSPQTPLAS